MAVFPRSIPAQKFLIREQELPTFVLTNPQSSVMNSLEFLKKMTVIAMSRITLGRQLFPEDAYLQKQCEGEKIRILKGSDEFPDTRIMVNWMKFAFQLVSQQYVRKIILVIQSEDATLESYVFNYDYDDEQIRYQLFSLEDNDSALSSQVVVKFPKDIAASIRQLLRSIDAIMAQLAPLPACEFSLRLELHEDTPDEAFRDSRLFKKIEAYDLSFPKDVTKWKLGKVPTKFSTFGVSLKSTLLEGDATVKDKEDEVVESSQPDESDLGSPALENESCSLTKTADGESQEGTINLSLRLGSSSSQLDRMLSCVCECDDDKFSDAIKCVSCCLYQHKSCYNVPPNYDVTKHICLHCHDPSKDRICSISELVNNDNKKVLQADALYRRALLLCLVEKHLSTNKIVSQLKVSRQKAQTLYNKLDFDGCFYFKSGRFGKTVDLKHVKNNVLNRYFADPVICTPENMDVDHDVADSYSKKRKIDEEKENFLKSISPEQKIKKQKIKQTIDNYQIIV